MVTGEQDRGYRSSVPDLGAGVLGKLQKAVPVAFVFIAFRVGEYAGDQPAHCISHGHGWNFTTCEHEVSQGDFLVHAFLNKALVNALVVAADQNQPVIVIPQPHGVSLLEGLSAGGHIDGAHPLALGHALHDMGPAPIEGIRLHHRSVAAAVGVVIHLILLVGGVVPDLMALHPDKSPLLAPAQNGFTEHVSHHIGEEGHNVNPHHWPNPSSR